jgi:SWI/SNF-related matrix-associated actin-dependent regulator 1 of chromatin subfamily A
VILQAEDRAHRIGQKSCVNIYYLFGKTTLDEFLYQKIQNKFKLVSNILDKSSQKMKVNKMAKFVKSNENSK